MAITDLFGKVIDVLKENKIIWVALFFGFLFLLSTTGNFVVGVLTSDSLACGDELQGNLLGLGNLTLEELGYEVDNSSMIKFNDFTDKGIAWSVGTYEYHEDTDSFNRSDDWVARSIYAGLRTWFWGTVWLFKGNTDVHDTELIAENVAGENYLNYANNSNAWKRLLADANFTVLNVTEYSINELMAIKCPDRELTLWGFPIFNWELQFFIVLLGFITVFALQLWYPINKV